MDIADLTLDIEQHLEIKADIGDVFRRMLYRFGEGNVRPDGETLNMILEPWPGGRWFRDRGNGIGHLWGHVQTIKPPTLLELAGPMFMSYPAINHVEVKLEQISGGTRLSVRHRCVGMIDPQHRQSFHRGWSHQLGLIQNDFQ
ncbi:hypothetical protein F183_A33900 [Bryobacterales bacterium F-183]|nr:hypothetical protein F183_A33900 [Bryobacterales bacterium F-183]